MKKFYVMVTLVTTGLLIQLGCQGFSEEANTPTSTRTEVLKKIIENPSKRIAIWSGITPENQYSIWKEKIDQISNQQLKPEWMPLFQELRANFSYELYQQALKDINKSTYLMDWLDRFSVLATEDERYFTIGSLYDYEATTNSINKTFVLGTKVTDPDEINTNQQKLKIRDLPGTGHDCDCKWTNCGSEEYCCRSAGTTGCSPTRNGCGFLWQEGCEAFCLNSFIYDCNAY